MASTSSFPGSACKGRHDVFDAAVGNTDAVDEAVKICTQCPALAACSTWAASLTPRERAALGVVGGIAPIRPNKAILTGSAGHREPKPPRHGESPQTARKQAQRTRIEAKRAARRAARLAASKRAS
ncbi:WhiB family transcriptional regulator [Mycobacterium sp. ENV421]|uniref:WhiB family transcriptional regulator n=1 Tax=Mycobacterium sp. ENV421 TaxID=1213407 RepID=UPI00336A057C